MGAAISYDGTDDIIFATFENQRSYEGERTLTGRLKEVMSYAKLLARCGELDTLNIKFSDADTRIPKDVLLRM